MLRPAVLALLLSLRGLAVAQDAPATPVAPPVPARGGEGGPPGDVGAGPGGAATPLPELLARAPEVARVSALLGAKVLESGSDSVALLHEFVARGDGRVVALVARPDGQVVGVPLSDMIARAKPDLESESGRVTITSFKLTRASRRLDAAPVVEAQAQLSEAWLAKLDAGAPDAPPAADHGDAAPAAPAPDPGDAPPAPPEPAAMPLPLLGALAGRTALDPAGQRIGSIADVVLDIPEARVAYLVVALPREGQDREDELRTVPFEALAPGAHEEGVRLTMDARALAASPALGAQDLPVDPFAARAGVVARKPR